jgi:IclR family KDG regulon transcriptional repressor
MQSDRIQSLERATTILDCFTMEQPQMGVREVARKTGLSSSTTGRMMAALKGLGVLNQDPQTFLYTMGYKVLAWSGIYHVTNDVRSLALPVMVQLRSETRETVSLYMLDGNERICVERLESLEPVRIVAQVGRRIPLYAGSAGKVFLAFLPTARSEEILRNVDLKPMTEKTITDMDIPQTDLEMIRKQGFAVSKGEWVLEASGVAAPIFDQGHAIAAALTISGPAQRFTDQKILDISRILTQSTTAISRELGYSLA